MGDLHHQLATAESTEAVGLDRRSQCCVYISFSGTCALLWSCSLPRSSTPTGLSLVCVAAAACFVLLAAFVRSFVARWREPPVLGRSSMPRVRVCAWAQLPHSELRTVARPTPLLEQLVYVGGAAGAGLPEGKALVLWPEDHAPVSKGTFEHELRTEQTMCPCCLKDFSPEDVVAVPRCGHVFCEDCLRSWAASPTLLRVCCPVCRATIEVEEA